MSSNFFVYCNACMGMLSVRSAITTSIWTNSMVEQEIHPANRYSQERVNQVIEDSQYTACQGFI